MRTITQANTGGPEVLQLVEVAAPTPGPGEVLVRVTAMGVNPVDAFVRAGVFPILGEPPFTVGWDVAGVVDALGAGVTDFAIGDRVFGMPRFPDQAAAYAELVLAPATDLARTPDALDDIHAAALPLAGLTAWQALITSGQLAAGDRVLIPAAGGGVGHLAVQIATAHGAHVVATASPRKASFVAGLGAQEVLDYTTTDLTGIDPVDLAIEPLGGDHPMRTLAAVRDGGVLALLLTEIDDELAAASDRRSVRVVRINVAPDPAALAGLVDLVARGWLRPTVQATYPLDQAAAAHVELTSGVQGKLVLVP